MQTQSADSIFSSCTKYLKECFPSEPRFKSNATIASLLPPDIYMGLKFPDPKDQQQVFRHFVSVRLSISTSRACFRTQTVDAPSSTSSTSTASRCLPTLLTHFRIARHTNCWRTRSTCKARHEFWRSDVPAYDGAFYTTRGAKWPNLTIVSRAHKI